MKRKCAFISMCLGGLLLTSCQSNLYQKVENLYPVEAGEQIADESAWEEAFDFDKDTNMTVKMRMTLDYSKEKDISSTLSSFEMNYAVLRMDNYFLITLDASVIYEDGDKFNSIKEQIFIDTDDKEEGDSNIYNAYYFDESFTYMQQLEFIKPLESEPLVEFDLDAYDFDNFDYVEDSKSYRAKDLTKFINTGVYGSNSELTTSYSEMKVHRMNISFENGRVKYINYIGLATSEVEAKSYSFPFACEYTIYNIGTTQVENPIA